MVSSATGAQQSTHNQVGVLRFSFAARRSLITVNVRRRNVCQSVNRLINATRIVSFRGNRDQKNSNKSAAVFLLLMSQRTVPVSLSSALHDVSYWHCAHSMRCRVRVTVRVRQSVCRIRPLHSAAAGLLLLARRAGDIDRLLPGAQQQSRRSTARSSKCGQRHGVR